MDDDADGDELLDGFARCVCAVEMGARDTKVREARGETWLGILQNC